MQKIVIGIDPGKDTGIGIYDPVLKKMTEVYSTNFFGAMNKITELSETYALSAVIERPNTKTVWQKMSLKSMRGKSKAEIEAVRNKIAVDVGSVINQADLLIEFLNMNDIPTITQHPQGKVDAKIFKAITGWKGVTNEHGRDAGMLCFGLNC